MTARMTEGMEGLAVERAAPVREQVANSIRRAITEMRLRPGQFLVERELCLATNTSRASVREALRQLESEGLVVSVPGRGVSVAELSREEARNLYELRGGLEAMAGRLFAERAGPQDQAALAAAVDRIRSTADDPAQMLKAKTDFYEVLFRGTGNPELVKILHALHRRITLLRSISLSVPGRPQQSVVEIQAILDAVRRGDGEAASGHCLAHVRAAAAAALSAFPQTPSTDGERREA
jgi:GntR family transcriptional regulator, trigonelline degradation regulator